MPLLTGPRFLDTSTAALPLRAGSRWLRVEWIVSRALCRYRLLDFTGVPRSKRAAALRLQLSQFAPFVEPGYAVAWEGAAAQVWCWDASRVRDAARTADVAVARLRFVPESVCYAPLDDGARLLKVNDGFEGQVWKERTLTRSRFWTTLPADHEWIAFERDAGLSPDRQAARPSVVDQPLLPQAYTKVGEGLEGDSTLALAEPAMLFVLVAALGIGSAWYLTRYWKLASRSDELVAQLGALGQSAAPVLAAREHAIDNEVFANRLAHIPTYPDQLSLMAEFATAFAADRVVLRDWNFNLGKLRVVVAFPNALPPTSNVVSAVQEQAAFANVRVAPANDPKSLTISADVKPVFKSDEQARS